MSAAVRPAVTRLLVLAALLAVIFGLSKIDFTSASEKSFRITDADITVEVQPDASLRVTERLRFKFTGSFSGAYRDIPLAAGVTARNISVSEPGRGRYRPGGKTAIGSFDAPGTFGATQLRFSDGGDGPTAGFRVVWHYNASNEQRDFVVSYDVAGAATAYDDVVSIPWAVWGDQWEFWLDRLDARITLRESTEAPVDAFLRPRKLGVDPVLSDGSAAVTVERVPQGNEVELTAVFPRSSFSSVRGAKVRGGDGLGRIRAEQEEIDQRQSARSKLSTFVADNVVPLGVLWTLVVMVAAVILFWRARERPSAIPRHLPEPPEDIPPALAYALAHEGGYDDRIVLATLLDLVDRGYFEATPSAGDELDLVLSKPDGDRPSEELTDYEERTLDFFDRLLAKGPERIGLLKDRVPEHSEPWRNRWTKLNDSLDRAEEGEISWERDLTGARAGLAAVALIGYLALAIPYFLRTHFVLLPLAFLLIGMFAIFLLPNRYLKRLDPVSRDRSARWQAFGRWTRDFPRLEDDPPATLKLWRRILVYAVALGTADKVIESGRIPAPVVAEAHAGGLWLLHTGDSGMTSSFTSSFDGFASGFSSHVAPESSSGGGGFSGGGGGSSGGGGGGAW